MIAPNDALLQSLVAELRKSTNEQARDRVRELSDVELVGLIRVNLNGYS